MTTGAGIIDPRGWQSGTLTPTFRRASGARTGYLGAGDFLSILRRRAALIAFVVAAGVLLTVIGLARTTPIYSATATVVVDPPSPAAASTEMLSSASLPGPSEQPQIETKVQMLQSRVLARKTAQSLRLGTVPEFAPPADQPTETGRGMLSWLFPPTPLLVDPKERAVAAKRARDDAIASRLMDRLTIDRVGRSNVIAITASTADPYRSALIANRLVDTYLRVWKDDARSGREDEIETLTTQVAAARDKFQRAETAAALYRRQHGLLTSQPEDSGNSQVGQLTPMLVQSQGESAAERRRAAASSASSPLLNDLRSQQAVLERKRAELGTFFGPGYPDLARTDAELAIVRQRIGAETGRVSADLAAQAAASQARAGVIGGSIAAIRAQSLGNGEIAVPLRIMERDAEAANALYLGLVGRLNNALRSQADINPDIAFVSKAAPPDAPSHPSPIRTLAVAGIAALLLGMILALVREMMDSKLRTADQVRRQLGLPVMAMIPDLGVVDQRSPYHMIGDRPRSRFAEAIRNLLIDLEARRTGSAGHVVVVTSPLEREGKNTIATSLGAAAAAIGRNAVVVDFDLRRPANPLALADDTASTGVAAFLSDHATVDDLAVVRDEARFALIGTGETPADPGSLIASSRLPLLIGELRERYDTVILNAPPILPVRDAKMLADVADSTLLVLRWGKTDPEAARVAIELFDRPITGAVINMVDYPEHAKRRYGDSIHHETRFSEYFEGDRSFTRWPALRRAIDRIGRRLGGHSATI